MIRPVAHVWARLAHCEAGAMAVEAVIIAPVLITLAIGGFEVSSIVARQTELQSAAAEAAAIVRASAPETTAQRTAIRDIVATSTSLTAQEVSVVEVYRCGNGLRYRTSSAECAGLWWWDEDQGISKYIKVTIADSYQPMWTEFGFGTALRFNVTRTILVG